MVKVCNQRCSNIKKYSRIMDGIKMCDPCGYCTKTSEIYCSCCRKKYRTRKTGKRANSKRSLNEKRM